VDDRVAVGLKFEAQFSRQSLNTGGWVYVTAKPVLNVERQELGLDDIAFTRIIDNGLWKAVSFLFQGPIKDAIKTKARCSLKDDEARMKSMIQASLSDPRIPLGVKISFQPSYIGLNSVQVGGDVISVMAEVKGPASIEVAPPSLLKD